MISKTWMTVANCSSHPRISPALRVLRSGALSKSELDYLAFVSLVDAGVVSIDAPAFELAQLLEVTPAKVSSFVYAYRVRTQSPANLLDDLANAIVLVALPADGNVVLNVEDRYWRETLISRLKAVGVYTDTSFNRERVTVPATKFAHVLTAVFGERAKGVSKRLAAERRHNAGSTSWSFWPVFRRRR